MNRKVVIPFGLCVGFAFLVGLLYWFRFGSSNGSLGDLDGYQLNRNVQIGRKAKLDPRLFFLAIDQTTYRDAIGENEVGDSKVLADLRGNYPWSREVYAAVIEKLISANARMVILDMLFAAPREGDDELQRVMNKYRDRVVVGSNFQEDTNFIQGHESKTDRLMLPSPSILGDVDHPRVSALDPRVGFVNVWPNDDGVERKACFYRTMEIEHGESPRGRPKKDSHAMASLVCRVMQKLKLEDNLPDSWEGTPFRYAGRPEVVFDPHSLYEIFIPSVWAGNYHNGEFFRDKIVIIGAMGNWAHDDIQTPFASDTPGPTVHLSILNAALSKDYLRETHRAASLMMTIGAGFLAFTWVCFVKNPYFQITLGVASVAAFLGLSLGCYNYFGLYLPVATPSISFFGGLVLTFVYEIVVEQSERYRLRGVLDRYMSKDLVKDVLDNPNSYFTTVGGVRKPVSILFSDVRGFTTMSEGADPGDLVKQLNEYLGEMVKIVFHHQGTIDKFIGDAVMAVWGNVVSGGEQVDASRAVKTALEMKTGLIRLNQDWRSRGMMELSFGIGINHGEVIVGNVGSEQKMEITVIGDAVNLASRLESLTKEYKLDLLVGESVAGLVSTEYYLQMADNVKVKGKQRPVKVYTVIGAKSESYSEELGEFLEIYHSGMNAYREGNFSEALVLFEKAEKCMVPNALSKIYIERCMTLIATPPKEWSGIYEMTKK